MNSFDFIQSDEFATEYEEWIHFVEECQGEPDWDAMAEDM